MNAPLNSQLLRLSQLLQLLDRARTVSAEELPFLMVNETSVIVPYRQAALWRHRNGAGSVAAVSGATELEPGGPYAHWLKSTLGSFAAKPDAVTLRPVGSADLSGTDAAEWEEWFPSQGLWCPLKLANGSLLGGVLFGRSDPWSEGELVLLNTLFGGFSQSLAISEMVPARRRPFIPTRRRPMIIGMAALALLILVFPLHSSILAPAEIAPASPAPIRAPFEGVVATIDVAPNTAVHKGDRLLRLDTTELHARSEVAAKALDMAQAEYSEAAQEALSDPRAKGKLALLESKVQQQQAEASYDADLLRRADVTAPIDGVAVFDDPTGWIGKPVVLGERIMVVASPTDLTLDIQVPVANVVTFEPGSRIAFFSNIDPNHPVSAALSYASYASTMTPEGVLAYEFRAKLDAIDGLRLGLKGTAKIYGPRQPLALWLLRRPLAVIRQWLAL